MGVLNIFKNKKSEPVALSSTKSVKVEKSSALKPVKSKEKAAVKSSVSVDVDKKNQPKEKIIGKTNQSYQVLIKPLVTEKAADLGAFNQYVFAVDSKINKIEVKKAIRSIYGVNPIKVNMINVLGRRVRYGKVSGRTKNWRKAIITLKAGDKIEIYEGV